MDNLNNVALANLSVINCFHNKNKSILDTIIPIVEYGISCTKTEYFSVEHLKQTIQEKSGIIVPTITLITLLKRFKRENKIELYENNSYVRIFETFSSGNEEYMINLGNKKRDINCFIDKYKNFTSIDEANETVVTEINSFFDSYKQLLDFNDMDNLIKVVPEKYKKLGSFLLHIEQQDNSLWNTFKEMFYGYLICTLLRVNKDIPTIKLSNTTVILDSNFIFRILELQEPFSTKISLEILDVLKQAKVRVAVFAETISSVIETLKYHQKIYLERKENLIKMYDANALRISGIIGAFIRGNYTNSDIEDIISKLDINYLSQKFDVAILQMKFKNDIVVDEKAVDRYLKMKKSKMTMPSEGDASDNNYLHRQAHHYIKLIKTVVELRKNKVFDLGSCKYVFLSCDRKLFFYNKQTHDNFFPEVITEERLMNSLALSNIGKCEEIHLQQLVSLFNSSKYLDLSVLDKFSANMNKRLKSEYNDNILVGRIYSNQDLFEDINDMYDEETDAFDEERIISLIQRARESDEEKNKIIRDQEKIISDKEQLLRESSEQSEISIANSTITQKILDDVIKNSGELQLKNKQLERELLDIKINLEIPKYGYLYLIPIAIILVCLTAIGFSIYSWIMQGFSFLSIIGPLLLALFAIFSAIPNKWILPKKIKQNIREKQERKRKELLKKFKNDLED